MTWSLNDYDKSVQTFAMSWPPVQQNADGSKLTDLAGYNIYGSALKEVGYGQLNYKLLKDPSWSLEDNHHSYYKIEAIDFTGNRSELSAARPYPEILAFAPAFKNIILIEPNLKPDNKALCAKAKIYDSLKHAIAEEGMNATFLINRKRADIVGLHNQIDNRKYENKVLYLDDLSFLDGKVDLFLPMGLDENSEICFYILYKISPEDEHNITFNLIGNPDIGIVNKNNISKHTIPHKNKLNRNNIQNIDNKTLLTPSLVFTYLEENTIYLIWNYPKDISYKGVRIFRTEMSNTNNLLTIRDEVYDGSGMTNKVKRINSNSEDQMHNKPDIAVNNYVLGKPPPKKKLPSSNRKATIDDVAPSSPFGFGICVIGNVNEKDGETLPYFADNNVSPDLAYTYTLYAYDDKDNYSYPIIINASLKEFSKNRSCELENK